MWQLSIVVTMLLCVGYQVSVGDNQASSLSAFVPSGNIHRHHVVKGRHWLIESKYLDVATAEAEANEQLKAGNCRLIGEYGYSVGISSDTKVPSIVPLIIVTDTGDVRTEETTRGLAKARAFGAIYNPIIEAHCDFSPARNWKSGQKADLIIKPYRPAK